MKVGDLVKHIEDEVIGLVVDGPVVYDTSRNLKTVVSAQRPIPTSWRKRTTGARTRYQIYLSKLSPELKAKEEYIENQYQKKLQQWRAAVSQYGAQYNLDFFPGPSK